jgi:hypothetical protein
LRLAAVAQATNLGLLPWECEPCNTYDDDVPDPACWGRRKPEVALRRKLLGHGLFEPDPRRALERFEKADDVERLARRA